VKWVTSGAIVAAVLSLVSLLLPPELGGYNAWNDLLSILHNIAAVLTRVVVFALVGAALSGAWHHKRGIARRRSGAHQQGAPHAVQGSSRRR